MLLVLTQKVIHQNCYLSKCLQIFCELLEYLSQKFREIGCDTEASGLKIPHFDSLSLIQLSGKSDEAYVIQPDRKNYNLNTFIPYIL